MLKQQNPFIMDKKLEFHSVEEIDLTYKVDFQKIIADLNLSMQMDKEIGLFYEVPILDFKEFTDYLLFFIEGYYGKVKGGVTIEEITSLYTIYELKNKIWN